MGSISGMALYPTIITLHCLSWDHKRIGHITAIALYPWALHFTLHVANSQISRSGLEQSDWVEICFSRMSWKCMSMTVTSFNDDEDVVWVETDVNMLIQNSPSSTTSRTSFPVQPHFPSLCRVFHLVTEHWGPIHMAKISSRESSRESSRKSILIFLL